MMKMSACWRSSSPSSKLFPFIVVPLVLVSGYVSLVGPYPSWPWGFSSTGAGAPSVTRSSSSSLSSVYISPVSEGKDNRVTANETAASTAEGEPEAVVRWKKEYRAGAPSVTPSSSSSSFPVSISPVSEGKDNRVTEHETAALTAEGEPEAVVRLTGESGAATSGPNPGQDITPLPSHVPAKADKNFTTAVPSSNDPHGLTKTELKIKEYTRLERLEAGLRRARSAIKQARDGNRTQDKDYVPVGPMYRDAAAFHRSYLEMEKTFKVFVYDEGEPPVFHNGPCKSIYSMEGNFIHMMEINRQFRTTDPDRAHAYFLPFSVAMLVQYVYVRDSHDFGPIKRTVVDYIGVLSRKYPYWNRSSGFDHFMLACHDWGPETSSSVPNLYKNSIRVLCNANTSEGFNPSKDVSFPEINLQTGFTHGLLGGPSPSRRPILAFFAGGLHGPIRPVLLQHWENKDNDIKVYKYLPKGTSYYDMMRKSRYCLCPSGYEVASPRVVEAIYTGCIPVLISDHYVPPFSDVLNWRSFSVEVPVGEIPNLKRILEGISSRQYIRMQRRVTSIRRHFEVNSSPRRYDVFHMILHSVWLRRLNVKVG